MYNPLRIPLAVLFCVLVIYPNVEGQTRKTKQRTRTQKQTQTKPAPVVKENPEAKREFDKWWDTYFAKCGDDYYTHIAFRGLYQMKNVTYRIVDTTPKSYTAAQKLNDDVVEWQGKLYITSLAYRIHRGRSWGSWFDGTPSYGMSIGDGPWIVRFYKKRGAWFFSSGEDGAFSPELTKPNCSVIPN